MLNMYIYRVWLSVQSWWECQRGRSGLVFTAAGTPSVHLEVHWDPYRHHPRYQWRVKICCPEQIYVIYFATEMTEYNHHTRWNYKVNVILCDLYFCVFFTAPLPHSLSDGPLSLIIITGTFMSWTYLTLGPYLSLTFCYVVKTSAAILYMTGKLEGNCLKLQLQNALGVLGRPTSISGPDCCTNKQCDILFLERKTADL